MSLANPNPRVSVRIKKIWAGARGKNLENTLKNEGIARTTRHDRAGVALYRMVPTVLAWRAANQASLNHYPLSNGFKQVAWVGRLNTFQIFSMRLIASGLAQNRRRKTQPFRFSRPAR